MSVVLCAHRFPNASFCKRRAREGSRFCGYHRADENLTSFPAQADVNPLDRLLEPSDAFAVMRETVNAARLGRIPPAQVYAVCAAVYAWLKVWRVMGYRDRQEALESQYVSNVLDAEASAGPGAGAAAPLESPPEGEAPPANGVAPFTLSQPQAGEGPRVSSPRKSGTPGPASPPAPLTGDALTRAVIETVLAPLRTNGRAKRKAPA
jgi:hypothetical protein